jgi:hypothetical protein
VNNLYAVPDILTPARMTPVQPVRVQPCIIGSLGIENVVVAHVRHLGWREPERGAARQEDTRDGLARTVLIRTDERAIEIGQKAYSVKLLTLMASC